MHDKVHKEMLKDSVLVDDDILEKAPGQTHRKASDYRYIFSKTATVMDVYIDPCGLLVIETDENMIVDKAALGK